MEEAIRAHAEALDTITVCIDCGTQLGRTAYELHGRYYCEQCFLREAEIAGGE